MPQIALRTARLTLVPLADEHLRFESELDADPEVMRFLGPPRTPQQMGEFHRKRMAVGTETDGLGFWVGLSDDEPVGWWLLRPPQRPDQGPVAGQAELGYRLLRRHWRRGFGSEGAGELLRHGFVDLGLDRIFAETMTLNAGSRAVMTSVGMGFVRTFVPTFSDPVPGTDQGDVEYAITREQWIAART